MGSVAYYGNIERGVEQRVEFADAGSLRELYELLESMGEIRGIAKTYRAPELIQLIKDVRNCKASFNQVPTIGGLRDAVIRLHDREEGSAPVEL